MEQRQQGGLPQKRPRSSDDEVFKMPSKPAASSHLRRRLEETPSAGSGLSDKARQRLQEHRRNKAQKKGKPILAWLLDGRN